MLDVHAPHKKMTGVKEMLEHLFIITLGLLIATQIEACQDWRGHLHLASEARASLRAEIEHNLGDLKDAQTQMKSWRAETDRNLAAMSAIQDKPNDPKAQHTSLNLNFHSMSLRDTAWRTAEATGALAYMPYDEAQRYAQIYKDQTQLLATQDEPQADVATMLGMINRFNWNKTTRITEEQASEMAGKLAEMKLHLVTSDLLLRECIEANAAFLEGRKAREDFEEHF
jgi:hypothetical protein